MTTDRGMQIVPTVTYADCPPLDVVMVPGGPGQQDLMEDEAALAFLRKQAAGAKYVTSVCTGSLVLGAAGLLKGKRATCHWAAIDHLKLLGAIPVREKVVVDGNIVTGAGVTSGIDFALTLAAILEGEAVAREIQLQIEYDPAPPFNSGSPKTAAPETLRSGADAPGQAERGAADGGGARRKKARSLGLWRCRRSSITASSMSPTGSARTSSIREVMGAELVARPVGFAYRFGDKQLNVHGPGVKPAEVARLPVQPGNSRSLLRMERADRRRHRASQGAWHRGRTRAAAAFRRQGAGDEHLFPRSGRLADGIHVLLVVRRIMKALLRLLIGVAMALAPAVASADVAWTLGKKQGRPFLQAMSTEAESDTEFWALCGAGGAIEIGVGADTNVGEGKGEPVTLTLASGPTRATLSGQSRNSANFQMTAGTELRAKITRGDAVFKVLAAGQPITASGSIKMTVTWAVKGLKPKVAAFLKACQ